MNSAEHPGPLDNEVDRRAREAAAGLRQAVALAPPELSDLVRAARLRRIGQVAFSLAVVVLLGAGTLGLASVASSADLRLVTGLILAALIIATGLLCAHAGGHAWFVPLPAVAFAVLWAVTVSGHDGRASWLLVALSAAMVAGAVIVGSTALRQRLRGSRPPGSQLPGAVGVTVTALSPVGVVRVASETWTATSLSGPLPEGAPVHVVRVDGVRLEVWSEAGRVPDHRDL